MRFFACIVLACLAFPFTIVGSSFAQAPRQLGTVERLSPEFDSLVRPGAQMEILADGFEWSEGPVWVKDGEYLLFSDIPRNRIVKWKEGRGTSIFMEPSGYTGSTPFTGGEPGTNGLTLDSRNRLVMCQHGDRRVTRLEPNGDKTILAERYEGKRLNSPNDLVYRSNGDLYFTDPPYGLPKQYDDPARELDFCGVYRISTDGHLTLLTKDMTRPNGIGFSPDEKILYVAQSDPKAAVWMAFPVQDDGTLGPGRVFYDATESVGQRKGLPDGMAVDARGNLWATGPGGVLVFSPQGKLLGRLNTGEATANCTFGENGRTLFITADMYLARIPTLVEGVN
jgi:gluconolactonase